MSGSPKITRTQKVILWKILRDGAFHKAGDIVDWSRSDPVNTGVIGNTRLVRAICQAEPDKFISTQAGYKRTDLATDDELQNARNDLLSRCRKMEARADAIDEVLIARLDPQQRLV